MSLLERVYFFHEQLKRQKYPNAKSLVEEFEISLATARRDIAYLRDRLLAPLEYSAKRNGFFYTEADFGLPFENSPKITLLLGMFGKLAEEAGLGNMTEVKQVEQKLASLLSPEYQKVIDAIHCEWVEVENVQAPIFETIIEAIVRNSVLTISYRSVKGEESERGVEPIKLVNYQGRWYLFAYCTLRKANRFFHVARIAQAVVTEEKISQPAKIAPEYLEQSFGIFKGEVLYQARILFSETAAELIQHQQWHKNQKLEKVPEGVILTLPVSDDREIIMKILQYGARAKVLDPEQLQVRVQEEIRKMQTIYP